MYEWSGESIIVGLFSAINESIFEHMKLLFFPMLLFAFFEAKFVNEEYDNYWCAKLIGILVGVGLIPVIYYTYTGIFGVNADWFNIIIFFITNLLTTDNCVGRDVPDAPSVNSKSGEKISPLFYSAIKTFSILPTIILW